LSKGGKEKEINERENKVSSFEFREKKPIGRAVPAVEYLLVGRAAAPAQLGRQWPTGIFMAHG